MKKLFIFCFFSILSSTLGQIREVNLFLNKRDISTIERETSKFLKAQKLPGMTLVIANKGKIIFSKSYGYASLSRKIKLEPKHKMAIGDLTQIFTVTAIMKLLEEGKISLEDTILGPGSIFEKEFPKVQKYEAMVKVKHLIEQSVMEWAHSPYLRHLKGKNNLEKIHSYLSNIKIRKNPGSRILDSDFAYFLLGRIIEKKTNKTYLEYLKEITTDHLQSDLSFMADSNIKDVALHYDDKLKAKNLGFNYWDLDAKTGLVCSPVDFMNLLLSIDGLPAKKDLLTDQAVKIMQTRSSVDGRFGKGWRISQTNDIFDYSYTKSSAAFKMRADGITWVFMANGKSNRGKADEKFFFFPEELLKKLKDIP